jgi:hypothetical protein
MDKAIVGLLGAASAIALASGAQASPNADVTGALSPARSYSELLAPIPDAARILAADDEGVPKADEATSGVQLAQYHHHHHHHHHHRRVWRHRHHHHHHHHHIFFYNQ